MLGLLAFASFDSEVISAVMGITVTDVHHQLGELVNNGILSRSNQRYIVTHALIHTYARRQIQCSTAVAEKLATYYGVLVNKQKANGVEGFALLDAERLHIVATLTACIEHGAFSVCQDLALSTEPYLDIRGHSVERIKTLQTGLSAAIKLNELEMKGRFSHLLGIAYRGVGELDRAIEYHQEALSVFRKIRDLKAEGAVLNNLGNAYGDMGDREQERKYHDQALAVFRDIGDRHSEGDALGNLGIVCWELNDLKRAKEYLVQALTIFRETRDKREPSHIL